MDGDGFHQMLASLAAEQQNNFYLVDTNPGKI
jgi:hypothetical protein